MVSGVTAYQQQVQQLQATQVQPQRQTEELRGNDRDRDDVAISRNRAEALNKANENTQTREETRQAAANEQPTQAGGKDAAQRRGSLLDISA
jgi:Asp-tRNA(Asn)/Glu-tRNA(Gln) amidotransferase C subunit